MLSLSLVAQAVPKGTTAPTKEQVKTVNTSDLDMTKPEVLKRIIGTRWQWNSTFGIRFKSETWVARDDKGQSVYRIAEVIPSQRLVRLEEKRSGKTHSIQFAPDFKYAIVTNAVGETWISKPY